MAKSSFKQQHELDKRRVEAGQIREKYSERILMGQQIAALILPVHCLFFYLSHISTGGSILTTTFVYSFEVDFTNNVFNGRWESTGDQWWFASPIDSCR
nr:autophagy-related protein 8f-like isoform X2 [Ipomoea trifida]